MKSAVWLMMLWAAASTAHAADYRAPRTSYGAPDLGGLWSNNSLTELERPDEFKTLVVPEKDARAWEKDRLGKPPKNPEDTVGGVDSEWWERDIGLARIRGQVRSSWLISPADGQLPYTQATKAARKARRERRKVNFDDPEGRPLDEQCLSTDAAGPPMTNGGYNDNYQFVQTRDALAIWAEYMHDVRIVRLGRDAHHPPAAVRMRMGDSIGHWEGDTLVIETTNFAPVEVDPFHPDTSADMRVVERLRRTGPGEITYLFRVEDPAMFAQSWMGEMVLNTTKGPIYEFACHEGNYGLPNILTGARREPAQATTTPPPSKPAGQ